MAFGKTNTLQKFLHQRGDSSDSLGGIAVPQNTLARSAVNNLAAPPPGTESLDFDLHESKQYVEYVTGLAKKDRKLKGGIRWLLIISVGMCTGLIAVGIDLMVTQLFKARFTITQILADGGFDLFFQYLAHVSFCVALSAVAGILVCFVEPLAAGSGIPEVKCYLNGVDLPRIVDFRTVIAKAPGVMFSVAAGLPCGKEGPMIHSGAVVGAVLSMLGNGPLLRPYRMSTETRDFVAAGAASGVAAAFGAPVGGVLFAVEEGASFMNPSVLLRTFVCSVAAALVARFFLAPLNDKGDKVQVPWGSMGASAPLSFGNFPRDESYMIWELGVWAGMAVFGGLCGALFNATNTRLTRWRMRRIGGRGTRRFIEVLVVATSISSIFFVAPVAIGGAGNADMRKFTSTEMLFWNPGGDSIKALFHSQDDFNPALLSIFACTYYVLACWTYGLGVPSGLFVPSLLTGAAFGRLFGQFLNNIHFTNTSPGIYALMGATAFLSGMARITISLAVILMEATGSTVWALPIFFTVMVSKWTGDLFTQGLYDIHIGLKHVPLLETFPEKDMIIMRARDVMNSSVLAVERVETVEVLLAILQNCEHHGFPVLHHERKHYIGMIKRSTIHEVLYFAKKHGILQPPGEQPTSLVPIIPYSEIMAWYPKYPSLKEIKSIYLLRDYMCKIDLGPYMNRGGYTVPEHAALTRVHMLFRNMGLRHLPVVSHDGDVVGTITRKDLILAHEEGREPQESIIGNSILPMTPVDKDKYGDVSFQDSSFPATSGLPFATRHGSEAPVHRESIARRESIIAQTPLSSSLANSTPLLAEPFSSDQDQQTVMSMTGDDFA